jgi:hypothetical protein
VCTPSVLRFSDHRALSLGFEPCRLCGVATTLTINQINHVRGCMIRTVYIVTLVNRRETSEHFFFFTCCRGSILYPNAFLIPSTCPKKHSERFEHHAMVYVFGNPVYGKRPAPGCSCIGQHYFGCGYNGPYVYNALLASTGSPAFGTVQEPTVKRAKCVCCAHML